MIQDQTRRTATTQELLNLYQMLELERNMQRSVGWWPSVPIDSVLGRIKELTRELFP